jgi:hypothetical protein
MPARFALGYGWRRSRARDRLQIVVASLLWRASSLWLRGENVQGGWTAGTADLLPLLSDPDDEVRQRAVWAMAGLGEGVLPMLQQVRRSGPGYLRRGALWAIAETPYVPTAW